MSKVGTICEAIYFTASIQMPVVDSCMLHGVGIRRNGAGHLFLGLPGDGKTTLAGLSPPEGMISDDGIIARREGSNYYLDPAPLDQSYSFKDDPGTNPAEGGRLAMGFFLRKDERAYLERALEYSDGSKQKAAAHVGIRYHTLWHRLNKLGIDTRIEK